MPLVSYVMYSDLNNNYHLFHYDRASESATGSYFKFGFLGRRVVRRVSGEPTVWFGQQDI